MKLKHLFHLNDAKGDESSEKESRRLIFYALSFSGQA